MKRIHLSLQTVDQWGFKYFPIDNDKVTDRFVKMASNKNTKVQMLDKVFEELFDEFEIYKIVKLSIVTV